MFSLKINRTVSIFLLSFNNIMKDGAFNRQNKSTCLRCSVVKSWCGRIRRQQPAKMPGETFVLRYSKLTEKAYDPVRGSDFAAGFDLRSAYDYTVPAHGKELVKTDIQVQIPDGCYGRIAPRSGLAWKNFIDVGAGVIDVDYRGNIGVVIFNHGNAEFEIKAGDRIAQLICEKIAYPCLEEVKTLDNTKRGSGGFGSTGTN